MASHHIPRTSNERNFPDTTDEDYDPIAAAEDSQRKQEARLEQMRASGSQRPSGSSGSDTYSDRYGVTFLDTNDRSVRYIGSSGSSPASTVATSFSDDESSSDARPQLGHSPQLSQHTSMTGQSQSLAPPLPGSSVGSAATAVSADFRLYPDSDAESASGSSSNRNSQQWSPLLDSSMPPGHASNPYLPGQSMEAQTQALNRSLLLSGAR